jgi:hypothetical protein
MSSAYVCSCLPRAACAARREKWGAFAAFLVLMIIAALAAGGSMETFNG